MCYIDAEQSNPLGGSKAMGKNVQIHFHRFTDGLADIYGLQNDRTKGRLIFLGDTLLAAIYNVFITGIFYTGFLSMYGISITGVGIVTFIPYIASCFSVFSPLILKRFKKRKAILLASKIYFYAMYIVATNIMPLIVTDPDARLVWFVVILFLAYSVNAMFSPGITSWFSRFFPSENKRRSHFFVLNQVFSSVLSSTVLMLSSLLMDAVADLPIQDTLIIGFRYFAFLLVIADVALQARAIEYPSPEAPRLRLRDVFTLPFRYKKFLLCMIFMFGWNFISALNAGMWNYHLMNHLGYSYTVINACSAVYVVILLLTNRYWEKFLQKYSWIKTFGLACIFMGIPELLHYNLRVGTEWLFIVTVLIQNAMSVPLNFSYANVLYMNLPEENSTAHIAFNTIGCNAFAFLGMITGTWITSLTGDETIPFLGMQVYSVQFTTLVRAIVLPVIGLLLVRYWRAFTKSEEVAEIEARTAKAK